MVVIGKGAEQCGGDPPLPMGFLHVDPVDPPSAAPGRLPAHGTVHRLDQQFTDAVPLQVSPELPGAARRDLERDLRVVIYRATEAGRVGAPHQVRGDLAGKATARDRLLHVGPRRRDASAPAEPMRQLEGLDAFSALTNPAQGGLHQRRARGRSVGLQQQERMTKTGAIRPRASCRRPTGP